MTIVPVDQPARERIGEDLDTNLLVEAGAGSGKTTALIGRMLSLVGRGTPVERVAAVTFTKKAANELREKFQQALEKELLSARTTGDAARVTKLDRALQDVEQAFIGTIHAFCARLLREHAFEAGLDPAFRELDETEGPLVLAGFWERWLDRQRTGDAPELAALVRLGVEPLLLFDAFKVVVEYPDVTFPTGDTPAPDITRCKAELLDYLAAARKLMPAEEHPDGWDALQSTVRRLSLFQRLYDWSTVTGFCESIAKLSEGSFKCVQLRWSDDAATKKQVGALAKLGAALYRERIAPLQRAWWEHRYPAVMAFLLAAAHAYEAERLATGRLNFQDLLLRAAGLLRGSTSARRALGERYRHLLVDEFQDTDPIQAEVCLLLASDPSEGTDWREVAPRPGALFVVGDPKQSIYRFRRADIQTYEHVKERFEAFGDVLVLTQNFRSVHPVGELVNAHFDGPLPETSSPVQAAFAPFVTSHEPEREYEGVRCYGVMPDENKKEVIVETDVKLVARWIASRIDSEQRDAGDFLVLTDRREFLAAYAREIAAHGIPVTTSGAALPQEHELKELVLVLRALADPDNPVLVAAALEGLFFGLSPADLYDAHVAGVAFRLTTRPTGTDKVSSALRTLHDWWHASQRDPADVLLARLLDDTGLLPYAASRALGDNRAGALLHLVEAVRGAATDPAPDLRGAIAVVEGLLVSDAPDALLLPGRGNAVKVMNLHKAKGLEAEVVILACPIKAVDMAPSHAIARSADGTAVGALQVFYMEGFQRRTIAQPPGWDGTSAQEKTFEDAEDVRKLYVAVTRAKRELVVGQLRYPGKPDLSVWGPLGEALAEFATDVAIPERAYPAAAVSPVTVGGIEERKREIALRHQAAVAAGWAHRTVTQEAKRALELPEPDEELRVRIGKGREWGRAVHRVLEARGRGRTGASLERFARAVAAEEQVEDVPRLLAIVERLEARGYWADGGTLVEVPVVRVGERDGKTVLLEGVIDAVRFEGGAWRVVDWKTDLDGVHDDPARVADYERQVGTYAEMITGLLNAPATARLEPLG